MSYFEEVQKELEAEVEFAQNTGSQWFKIKEGTNQVRILTRPTIFFEKFKVGICYHECNYQGTPKFLTWVIDREDGEMKLMRLPYSFIEQIGALEKDEDFNFKSFPMPYDLKIEAKGAGTKEVKYSIFAKPPFDLTNEQKEKILTLKDTAEIIEKMKEAQKEKDVASGAFGQRQAEVKARQDEIRKLKAEAGVGEPVINYPEEEINPDDINFDQTKGV